MPDADTAGPASAIVWFRHEFHRRLCFLGPLLPWLYRFLFQKAEQAYLRFQTFEGPIFTLGLRECNLRAEYAEESLAKIPRHGPVVIVANHPHCGLEGLLLGDLLCRRVRGDFRFLATSAAAVLPRVSNYIIPLVMDPGPERSRQNAAALRKAVEWLRGGGLLVVFPAGAVAQPSIPSFAIAEQPWQPVAARLARLTRAYVLPVYFHGVRHWTFYAARLLHRDLPYLALAWKEWRAKPRSIRISIGDLVPPGLDTRSDVEWTKFLRSRTLALGTTDGAREPRPR
ncbi:MAG: 1-acyl-sn-glycerol-3-phosphate acyltransferase [Bryobacteraceae bacterium]